MTVTRLVSLPKTRLWTTTGRYMVKYTLCNRSRHVSLAPQSMEWEALNVVQELNKLSAHNCSEVLGILLKFCDGSQDAEYPVSASASCLPPCFPKFAIGGSWLFRGVFCVCFVLFGRPVKLRETAIEQQSLQTANNLFSRSPSLARLPPFIREVLVLGEPQGEYPACHRCAQGAHTVCFWKDSLL